MRSDSFKIHARQRSKKKSMILEMKKLKKEVEHEIKQTTDKRHKRS